MNVMLHLVRDVRAYLLQTNGVAFALHMETTSPLISVDNIMTKIRLHMGEL